MGTKVCTKCKEERPKDQFCADKKRRDGLQPWCKICNAQYHKNNYEDEGYKNRRREVVNQRWRKAEEFLYQYLLEHPCVDCGEADPLVLEFDHVRGTKFKAVTSLRSYKRERLLDELLKCEVRCSNCHTRVTAMRANTIRYQRATGQYTV